MVPRRPSVPKTLSWRWVQPPCITFRRFRRGTHLEFRSYFRGFVPGSLTVIGGGVIGIEFASLFVRLGTKVTVVEALPRVLMPADEEASKLLTREMERQGTSIKTKCMVQSIERTGDTVKTVFKDEKGQENTVESELCLVAIGRGPLTENIGLENTRVKTEKGYIVVNGMMETDEPGIYAIGDCV